MDLTPVNRTIQGFIEDLDTPFVETMHAQLPKGKMLRAKLVKMIAPDAGDADTVAAVIETIHLSSLLHDDVIDEALTRRGEASINALYSDKHAVMLGDIFYSKAFFELVSLDERIAKSVSSAVTKLSLGELLDVELGNAFNPDRAAYENMIYLKTAALIESTAYCGAVLAGKELTAHETFGRNLGLAYQIIDDILDVTQDEATLGKPAFNDYKEGKTTLPYILMYESLGEGDRERLVSLFKQDLSSEDAAWIRARLKETGAVEASRAEAKRLAKEAMACAGGDAGLVGLIETMISRSY